MINASKLPVFTTDTLFIGKGSTGGKLVPIKDLGEKAGRDIVGMLEESLSTPFVQTAEDFEYISTAEILAKNPSISSDNKKFTGKKNNGRSKNNGRNKGQNRKRY